MDRRVGQDLDHQGRLSCGVVGIVFEACLTEIPISFRAVEHSDVVFPHVGFWVPKVDCVLWPLSVDP